MLSSRLMNHLVVRTFGDLNANATDRACSDQHRADRLGDRASAHRFATRRVAVDTELRPDAARMRYTRHHASS